MARA
ncbi:hypothetical protein RSOL_102870 [Rhizoctonia solani AG-3 Rhs1AP]|jgi:hypothetical protein